MKLASESGYLEKMAKTLMSSNLLLLALSSASGMVVRSVARAAERQEYPGLNADMFSFGDGGAAGLAEYRTAPATAADAAPTSMIDTLPDMGIGMEIVPEMPPEPVLPSAAISLCSVKNCSVAVQGNATCFKSLAAAIHAAPAGGVIELGEDIEVEEEIHFAKSIEIRSCGEEPSMVSVSLNATEGGLLRPNGTNITVALTNVHFNFTGEGYSSLLRTPAIPELPIVGDMETWQEGGLKPEPLPAAGYPVVNVFVQNCHICNFKTLAIGGAAIHVAQPEWFVVVNSSFVNNTVVPHLKRFDAGGAIWVRNFDGYRFTVNDSYFYNNHHEFEHGIGGAIGLNYLTKGLLEMHHTRFFNNTASAGGALFVEKIEEGTTMNVNGGVFQYNRAVERGWGSRGGAMWLQSINGTVSIVGLFEHNMAEADRGAVISNNILQLSSSVELGGFFINNTCLKGGAVWDTLGSIGFADSAKMTILDNSIMSGNVANGTDRVIRLKRPQTKDNVFFEQSEWAGKAVTFYATEPKTDTVAMETATAEVATSAMA